MPYAIDFMNPAPDADLHSVGQANFDWIVNAVAELAVKKADRAGRAGDVPLGSLLDGVPARSIR